MPVDYLGQARARHVFHRVPRESGPAHDVIDADDVGMPESRGELRLAPEAFQDAGIGRQVRVQDLDRHVALQGQIARAIHTAEPTGADLFQQLVVVAERAPQSPLETRLGEGGSGCEHLEGAGITHEVLEHLRRRVVAVLGHARERAHDDALDRRGNRLAKLTRRRDLRWVKMGRVAREGGVDICRHGIHVAGRLARFPGAHLGRHVRGARVIGRERREVGKTPVREPQVGNDALAAAVDHQG